MKIVSLPPALTSFQLPITQYPQGLWGDGTYVMFITEQKSLMFITYSHYFDQFHVFVVIHPHCKRKSLWSVLAGTLIYGHKHNCLEDNWMVTSWEFTKIHYLSSCRTHNFPSHKFLTKSTVPDVNSFPGNRTQVQSENVYSTSKHQILERNETFLAEQVWWLLLGDNKPSLWIVITYLALLFSDV